MTDDALKDLVLKHSNTSSKHDNSVVNIKDVTKQADTPIMYQQQNLK